jgi:predicted nucleic acid-binding protein
MAIVDTNVAVRYLTDDPPGSSATARELMDALKGAVIPTVVLAEIGFVLSSFYGLDRTSVVEALIQLINKRNVSILELNRRTAVRALRYCQPSNRVSFADALTWAAARESGIGVIVTYDRRFPSEGVELRHE